MPKTNVTNLVESLLFERFFLKDGYRCALEVKVPVRGYGRCDLMCYNKDNKFIIIEIKTSLSDFKSKNGHNFIFDIRFKNYYAVTKSLCDKVKDIIPQVVGLISVDLEATYIKYSNSKERYDFIRSIEFVKKGSYGNKSMFQERTLDKFKFNVLTASNSNTRLLLNKLYIKPEESRLGQLEKEKFIANQHSA